MARLGRSLEERVNVREFPMCVNVNVPNSDAALRKRVEDTHARRAISTFREFSKSGNEDTVISLSLFRPGEAEGLYHLFFICGHL